MRLLVLLLMSCASEPIPQPDAALEPDACVREPDTDGCCAYLPDENAVRGCLADGATNGECGVGVCWQSDCTLLRINFCGARVD